MYNDEYTKTYSHISILDIMVEVMNGAAVAMLQQGVDKGDIDMVMSKTLDLMSGIIKDIPNYIINDEIAKPILDDIDVLRQHWTDGNIKLYATSYKSFAANWQKFFEYVKSRTNGADIDVVNLN